MKLILSLAAALVLAAIPLSAQSLAEASEAAKKVVHEWPLSVQVVPVFNPANLPAPIAVPVLANLSEGKADPLPVVPIVKDEAYWRARAEVLHAKKAADVHASQADIDSLAHLTAVDVTTRTEALIYGPEILRMTAEVRRWTALLEDDNAAIRALEEEGRRASALPGWFR